MPKRSRGQAAVEKAETAVALGSIGASVGGPVGGAIGGLTGLIIGDETIVFPMDMVAIPAFEYASLTMGQRASFMIYIKEGEVLRQVQETDAMVAERALEEDEAKAVVDSTKPRRKTKYQRKYSSAFDSIKEVYMKKDGTWKKGGFKRAVKAAHAKARKEMK